MSKDSEKTLKKELKMEQIRSSIFSREDNYDGDLEGAEKQSQKVVPVKIDYEVLGILAGSVVHDLKNVLSPLLSYCELVMSELEDNDILLDDLEQIMDAAQHANELSKELLSMYRKEKCDPVSIDVNSVILENTRLLKRVLKENIVVDLKLSDVPVYISVEHVKINQIILNMAVNAMDAMRNGGSFVIGTSKVIVDEFTAGRPDKIHPGEYVLLSFKDSGAGIPDEIVSDIFEMGFTTKGENGNGIGLGTVKNIIENAGGFFTVISGPSRGALFNIYFPTAENRGQKSQESTNEHNIKCGNGEVVLVVDDDDSSRRLAVRILDKYGYDVFEAADAQRGLDF
ncbi:MAG: hypothetical protein JXR91_06430, partial [Deltaproteobacteria bacterium]|nr:hypothetical protein [Deltaproteobacteria bacterium]